MILSSWLKESLPVNLVQSQSLFFSCTGLNIQTKWIYDSQGVDTDVIRLLGHWRLDDEMLRYLHTSAEPLICVVRFLRRLFSEGGKNLIPLKRKKCT